MSADVLRCEVIHWGRSYTIELEADGALDLATHWLSSAACLAELLPALGTGDFTAGECEAAAGSVSELIHQSLAVLSAAERLRLGVEQ